MDDMLKKIAAKAAHVQSVAVDEPKVAISKPALGKAKGREVLKVELSDDEMDELRAKAKATVEAKYKKIAKDKMLAQLIQEIEQESIPEQQVQPLLIDLAGHSNKIVIDGRPYYHGMIYNFTQAEYDGAKEIMANSWRHEREVGGANYNHYHKPANAVLRPGDEGRPLSSLVHA